MRKAKIVATLGPSTGDYESIKKLIELGVNVIRLNFSHGDHAVHLQSIKDVRKASKETGISVAILQDISGPKIRIGEIEDTLWLKRKDIITLSKNTSEDTKILTLSYPGIIDQVSINEEVYFADGTIKTTVINKTKDTLVLELQNDGKLTSRKGVNFPSTKLDIDVITKKDELDLEFGAKHDVDLVALSFVQKKEDILKAKSILAKYNSSPMIISKIETKRAIDNLDEIMEVSDGIMVARGDLGAELGVERVPSLQKIIIKKANEKAKPVITATQMLLSMVHSPFPTRAEVSDVANALHDGSDAVMLSDETTIGEFPFDAIRVLNTTIEDTEAHYDYLKRFIAPRQEVIAQSAAHLSMNMDVDFIATFTTSGASAINMSKYRPKKDIVVITHDEKTLRKLNVVWGVYPSVTVEATDNTEKLIYDFLIQENKRITKDSTILITMGYIAGNKGSTNLIRVLDDEGIQKIKKKFDK